jgi:hypothetical protein
MECAEKMNGILRYAILCLIVSSAPAQEVVSSIPAGFSCVIEMAVLPDAPEAGVPSRGPTSSSGNPSSTASKSSSTQQQTKLILGIVPNFRALSAGVMLPPQSVKEKFATGLRDSFDYSSFLTAGVQAGLRQKMDYYPAFRQGAAGFSRYYWRAFADQADRKLWVESIFPTVLHEDNRYYTLGRGSFVKRAKYALTRAVITRDDNGATTFNVAEVIGSGAAAGISSSYYPSEYRTWTKTGEHWLANIALDSGAYVAREFWPDIHHAVFRRND